MPDNIITTLPARYLRDERLLRFELEEVASLHHIIRLVPRVKILIVTDGSGSFDATRSFGLGRVINEMASDPWWWVRFEITTAHRRNDLTFAATATHKSFNFATPPVALNTFDQIWLFGVESFGAISAAEVTALTTFMNNGGGIFATGDHEDLGAPICADLPRISKMRRWRTGGPAGTPPPVAGPNRHDTLREGPTVDYQFEDQSDNTPQVIAPTRYYDPFNYSIFKRRWRPHPVLCGRNGIINVLPDHMHEGWIVAPTVSAASAEWPGGVGPEVIAQAHVFSHHTSRPVPNQTTFDDVTNAKDFGVLGAYNGHPQGVGRIVVDATWHHWFNINLMGFDTSSAHYDKIRNYFWNVGVWLAPPAKQTAMFHAAIYGLIWVQPFNELTSKLDSIYLGFTGIDALGRRASQCMATEWIINHLPSKLREPLKTLPWPPPPDPPYRVFEHIRELAFGNALREVMRNFGPESGNANTPEAGELAAVVQRGLVGGVGELLKLEARGLEQTKRMLEQFNAVLNVQ